MDKIADMLITIKNAGMAGKDLVSVPYSKYKHSIADCLLKEEYVSSVSKKTGKGNKEMLEIGISLIDKKPKITQVERVSKPSKRIYMKAKDIKPVRHGYGLIVLSTPKGILTGSIARKELVGGEALFKIW